MIAELVAAASVGLAQRTRTDQVTGSLLGRSLDAVTRRVVRAVLPKPRVGLASCNHLNCCGPCWQCFGTTKCCDYERRSWDGGGWQHCDCDGGFCECWENHQDCM